VRSSKYLYQTVIKLPFCFVVMARNRKRKTATASFSDKDKEKSVKLVVQDGWSVRQH
jgi:hypothetical protein